MIKYTLIKSFRKTMALQIKGGEIIVKAPYFVTKSSINLFVEKHTDWIEKKLAQKKESVIDPNEIEKYKKDAKNYIPRRVEEIAKKYGIKYNSIKITSAKSRWGSCTSKRNLNFSYRLILTPKEVIDYVIVHELSHLKEMNHSRRFWAEVERIMPEYKIHEKWLKENGDLFSI